MKDNNISVDDLLDMVWGGALDVSTSDDFKKTSGDLDESKYVTAKYNIQKKARQELYDLISSEAETLSLSGVIDLDGNTVIRKRQVVPLETIKRLFNIENVRYVEDGDTTFRVEEIPFKDEKDK